MQKTNFKRADDIICMFRFMSSDWDSIEKYVIFSTKKGKNVICSIGKSNKGFCRFPKELLNENKFFIQIYANNNLFTDKTKIDSFIESDYCSHTEVIEKKEEKIKKECGCHEEVNTDYIINNIEYKDNKILFYSDDKLIQSINIIDQKLLDRVREDYDVDMTLSSTSKNPIANKTVYNALLDFLKESDLSTIALTGDYNDLLNIPTEFNPKHHNHVVVDVVDYEENINIDLNALLDALGDEIAKE